MTELQKLQAAYAHFSLDEWKYIAQSVKYFESAQRRMHDVPAMKARDVEALLTKLPSAAL